MATLTLTLSISLLLLVTLVVGERPFLLERPEVVIKTDAGDVRVVRGYEVKGWPSAMHIGFITMEPNTLFLPQYMDANLILFVKKGQVRIGRIHNDELVEKELKKGDVYRIPAGYTFYMINYGKGQRLHIICSIDTTESIGPPPFQSFFIGGGGHYPTSLLAGFDIETLSTAFNVTEDELDPIMRSQGRGPIVYMGESGSHQPRRLATIMRDLQKHKYNMEEEGVDEGGKLSGRAWTWRNFVDGVVGKKDDKKSDSYNLYDRKPDFQNTYGWSVELNEHDYPPLKWSGIGVYLVNLTAGSMLAPHINPRATEYGVVLSGYGTLQVVHPNGSSAMNVEVAEGDVFWIPRYLPFCQTASKSGHLEFFGFTTSSKRNNPQFLAGGSSILKVMMGPELATALDTREGRLEEVLRAQKESVILPSWPKPYGGEEGPEPVLSTVV